MRRRLGWVLYILLLTGITLVLVWARGVFLPRSRPRTETVLFEDGTALTLTLARSACSASRGDALCWESDASWHVQDFAACDIDRDGSTELLLLVWRRGNYGPSKPFWVKRNDTRWSQHIFIYNWQGDTFVPQWMSSQLRPQVARWSVQDADTLFILTPDGTETLWQWGHWGLVRTG